jgi:Raf kinase inhibitor-like YbhB/YbcL family protein
MEKRFLIFIVTTLLVWILISCTPAATPVSTSIPPESASPSWVEVQFDLSSSAFQANQAIPVRYACHGEDLSPPLAWSQPPTGTQSFALIMDDPDAVNVAGFVWDHWLVFNLPANILSLPEGIPPDAELPDGSCYGRNSFKRLGYGGPCPPSGHTHSYVFTLYALDTVLDLEAGASKDEILEAMNSHILGQAELIGSYTSP